MSAVASSPSTPGRDSAVRRRSSSSVRFAMAVGVSAGAKRTAGGMVAGDDHQIAVRIEQSSPTAGRQQLRYPLRMAAAHFVDVAYRGDEARRRWRIGWAAHRAPTLFH